MSNRTFGNNQKLYTNRIADMDRYWIDIEGPLWQQGCSHLTNGHFTVLHLMKMKWKNEYMNVPFYKYEHWEL